MAGPTVTLEFAGDEKKLTSAMDRVGESSREMGSKVGTSSQDFERVGKSAEDWAEKTDTVDTRAMGFRDTITGLQDSFKGLTDSSQPLSDRLLTLGMGVGDLASGFTNFLIPQMASFWTWLTSTTAATWAVSAAQTAWATVTKGVTLATEALNAVIKANPIMFIVGLIIVLVTAFVSLWQHSAGFRDFFIGMWNGIKTVIGKVVGWVVDLFTHFPERIGSALASLGGVISGVFKGALNGMIDGLNWFLDHSLNWAIDRLNDLSGIIGIPAIPHIPHIPRLHTGGVVPGMPGSEQLMVLQAGETVTPAHGGESGGGTVTFVGDTDSAFAKLFMRLVRTGVIQVST